MNPPVWLERALREEVPVSVADGVVQYLGQQGMSLGGVLAARLSARLMGRGSRAVWRGAGALEPHPFHVQRVVEQHGVGTVAGP